MKDHGIAVGRVFLLAALLALVPAPVGSAQPVVRRVVVVSIDGARPDGLRTATTPNITNLWKRGAYSFHAQTISPSLTLPSHTSMLTGLTPKRHGMIKRRV